MTRPVPPYHDLDDRRRGAVIGYDDIRGCVVIPDACPTCGEPRVDTGCDAPGCAGAAYPCCGTGCDIEYGDGRCAQARAEEDEEDRAERLDRERAAFGLRPGGGGDRLMAEMSTHDLLAEIDRLRARVRALHRQVCAGRCGAMPDHCGCADSDTVCETCHEMWPCHTISALDGEEATDA